jgi:phosphoribosylaminoimidazolecarboxamide formyltransferase / IMP cyclohydrolase
MAIRPMEGPVTDIIPVNNILVSVFDKAGLDDLVKGIFAINPSAMILSTGGTYTALQKTLGAECTNLVEVASYTGFPEMKGGLVKTLHPKIHAGILGERNNPEHQKYLKETLNGGVYIDMVVVNLYPFEKVMAREGATFEDGRGNIDIGGPTMLRAAAKNFPSCASVCRPDDYNMILEHLCANKCTTDFALRFDLMKKVFEDTAKYDTAIAKFMGQQNVSAARAEYKILNLL